MKKVVIVFIALFSVVTSVASAQKNESDGYQKLANPLGSVSAPQAGVANFKADYILSGTHFIVCTDSNNIDVVVLISQETCKALQAFAGKLLEVRFVTYNGAATISSFSLVRKNDPSVSDVASKL